MRAKHSRHCRGTAVGDARKRHGSRAVREQRFDTGVVQAFDDSRIRIRLDQRLQPRVLLG
jgi:hypothetical protein